MIAGSRVHRAGLSSTVSDTFAITGLPVIDMKQTSTHTIIIAL
jgi:hypothetical protein